MSSIFTQIINGRLKCYKIYEDDLHFAFLDISPLTLGHTLVIPKKEVDYIFDLSQKQYTDLWNCANKIAKAIDKSIPCTRISISVVGLEVPHVHIHLVPINSIADLNFSNRRMKISDEKMIEIRDLIVDKLF